MDGWMDDLLLDFRGDSSCTFLRCHLRNCDGRLASPMISACNHTNKLPANLTKFVTILATEIFFTLLANMKCQRLGMIMPTGRRANAKLHLDWPLASFTLNQFISPVIR